MLEILKQINLVRGLIVMLVVVFLVQGGPWKDWFTETSYRLPILVGVAVVVVSYIARRRAASKTAADDAE